MKYQTKGFQYRIFKKTVCNTVLILKCLVFVSLVIVSMFASVVCQSSMDVSGRVVDENNRPLKDVTVSWQYEPKAVTDLVEASESHGTLEDGSFGFVVDWKPSRRIRVFFESSFGRLKDGPVDVTSASMREYSREKSRLIDAYNEERDLGSVSEIIQYGLVMIDLTNTAPTLLSEISNHVIYLRVFDKNGIQVSNASIKPAYSIKQKHIEFRLPEGEWVLKLVNVNNDDQEFLCKRVFVKRNEEMLFAP